MKILHTAVFAALILFSAHYAEGVVLEYGYDRPGGSYVANYPNTGSAQQCAQMCSNNPACVAFTWVKPGVQGPTGVCWLKGSLSGKAPNKDCVSGVVRQVKEDYCKWEVQGTTYTCKCQDNKTKKWYVTNPGACKGPKPPPRYIDHRPSCPPGQVWHESNQTFGQGEGYCGPR